MPKNANPFYLSENKAYKAWANAKSRCVNPKCRDYASYGGRGITMCDRWQRSFFNFIEDMGFPSDPKLQLSRKNNDGPYDKENCEWATRTAQQRNKTITHWITFGGVTACLADWAEKYRLTPNAVRHRLRKGWSLEETFLTPLKVQIR